MKFKTIAIFLLLSFISTIAQLDRSIQPKAGPAPEIKLGDYESFTLENGLKVFVIENHKIPKITFSLILDRDPILEKGNVGYIDFAGELLRRGTTNRTKDQIDEEVDFIGASLNTSGSSIYGSSLTKHFDKLMQIFSDVLLNSDFKQEELDKLKKQALSGLAAGKDDPDAIASNLRKVLTFGADHPYGEVMTEKTVDSINLDLTKKYYKENFRPNIAMLAFVGDINVDEAKKLAQKYLGSWEKKEVKASEYKTPTAPLVTKVAISNRDASVQSVISVVYPVELKKNSQDIIKASVMNTILGGTFSARLNQNLREKHGYTYGAGSSLSSDKLIGSFTASATVRNEVTDSAITEIFNEMKILRNEKVTADELDRIKNYLNGSFSRALESPQTIARFALNIERYNLPKDYYKNYLKNLSQVTAEDVQEMAKKYLKPNNAQIIVVSNAAEVADKLTKFSTSGKIQYYDNYGNEYDPNLMKAEEGVTAETVIEKYIEAIGGREKIAAVIDKTMEMKGTVQGMDIKLTMSQKAPNKLFQELDFSVGKQTTVFDGEKGKVEGMGQVQNLEGDLLEEMKYQASMNLFLDYAKNNIVVELGGIENINGKDAYKIVTTLPTGKKSTQYYDKESGLKIREVNNVTTPQGSFTQTIDTDDYKDVDGLKFPFKLTQSMGPQSLTLEVTSIKINTGLNDSIFEVK
ncbi:MAG: insulinase family protein [Ignavibacteriales bacterium]|nr:insulinase family protein [Ignavibacteriales bacterium]